MRLVPITLIVIRQEFKKRMPIVHHAHQNYFFQIALFALTSKQLQVMPDDHSKLVPPLPIPNRTVKRLCADDSAETSVKVGYRQAFIRKTPKLSAWGFFALRGYFIRQMHNLISAANS